MNSLLTYIFLGISLAAPVGPVNAAQLDTGIKNGFFHAWIFGLGALAADVLYMILVYFGVGHFIELPFMQTLLWLFGCFVLTYTGIENLLTLHKIEVDIRSGRNIPLRRSLLSGFFMSLLNPLTILFWLGIYGSVLAETADAFTENQVMIYSMAIISGVLLWDLTMAFLSSGARRFLSTTLLEFISVLSSISMIGFGIYFGIQAYQVLF
ncbi:LysE family transporter [Domibacillus aminovorans]|uniref:Amino acid transporter n=1 Tax=Domibacillus aminovorans TaxID=29332 RepID=A0A177L5S8_9BACI|nr:LysE family transporter [Domibacillus aminovorans]OAH60697.1 amino acid transporter [Domibacillus aminovorans]